MAKFEEEKKKEEEEKARIAKELEDAKKQREELQVQLETKEKELEKLRAKDTNFKRLRDMTEEELEKMTEKEKELQRRQETLEEETTKFRADVLAAQKREAIARLSGGDEETAKKIEEAYNEFSGEDKDKESIEARALKAARYVKGSSETGGPSNPILGALSHNGQPPQKTKPKNYTETEDGQKMADALGIKVK